MEILLVIWDPSKINTHPYDYLNYPHFLQPYLFFFTSFCKFLEFSLKLWPHFLKSWHPSLPCIEF